MIEAIGLTKEFRVPDPDASAKRRGLFSRRSIPKQAVSDISFTIPEGEFAGFIGPNGAGKSTTIKMLSGILHPTQGEVRLGGINPHRKRKEAARTLGVLFGQRTQLWWDLPLRDSYDILAAMYGLTPERKKNRIEELENLLRLSDFMDTPVRKLSLGQRMRGDLAAAMLHEPSILILDEPTIGLDAASKRDIRSLLRDINERMRTTILLTTHDMDDIEQLCGRVLVISKGKLDYDGGIAQLRARIGLPAVMEVTFRQAESAAAAAGELQSLGDSATEAAGGLHGPEPLSPAAAGIRLKSLEDRTLVLECDLKTSSSVQVLRELEKYGELEDIRMREPEFEDVVHKLY